MSQPANLPNEASEDAEPAAVETQLPQPENSPITIERFLDGLTITVPPAGLWKGTHGLFLFAILWNGFMGVFTPLLLVGIFTGKGVEKGAVLIAPAVLSIFWLVGIGILLGALNMGKRRAAIAVTGGALMVIQTGLFGTKQRQWVAMEIRRICAGHSGMEVNDRPILELQIYGQGAAKFGLLAGRTDEELNWIASELRVALGVT
jgi:hypothetical protein